MEAGLSFKSHRSCAICVDGFDGAPVAVTDENNGANLEFAARPHERTESGGVVRLGKKEEQLRVASSQRLAQEAGLEDPGPVDDEEIPFLQMLGKAWECVVLDCPCRPIKDQKSGGASVRRRDLRDQLWRQVVIEVGCFQKSFLWGRSASGRAKPKWAYAR